MLNVLEYVRFLPAAFAAADANDLPLLTPEAAPASAIVNGPRSEAFRPADPRISSILTLFLRAGVPFPERVVAVSSDAVVLGLSLLNLEAWLPNDSVGLATNPSSSADTSP